MLLYSFVTSNMIWPFGPQQSPRSSFAQVSAKEPPPMSPTTHVIRQTSRGCSTYHNGNACCTVQKKHLVNLGLFVWCYKDLWSLPEVLNTPCCPTHNNLITQLQHHCALQHTLVVAQHCREYEPAIDCAMMTAIKADHAWSTHSAWTMLPNCMLLYSYHIMVVTPVTLYMPPMNTDRTCSRQCVCTSVDESCSQSINHHSDAAGRLPSQKASRAVPRHSASSAVQYSIMRLYQDVTVVVADRAVLSVLFCHMLQACRRATALPQVTLLWKKSLSAVHWHLCHFHLHTAAAKARCCWAWQAGAVEVPFLWDCSGEFAIADTPSQVHPARQIDDKLNKKHTTTIPGLHCDLSVQTQWQMKEKCTRLPSARLTTKMLHKIGLPHC